MLPLLRPGAWLWFLRMTDSRAPVLLYDGTCALCNGFVRMLLRIDSRARMRFAPLQSAPAQEFLRAAGLPTESFESLVFVPDWNNRAAAAPLLRTDGALAAFREIGGAWRAVAWLRVLPAFVRDPAYRIVARTRHALFGEYRPRPLGRPDWERRFIAR